MPSLDATQIEANKTDAIDDDWDVLTGGGEEEKECTPEKSESETLPEKNTTPEPASDVTGKGELPPEEPKPEEPKPAASKKLTRRKSSMGSEPIIKESLAVNHERLARGASILQDIGEVLIYLGGIVKQDCKKRAGGVTSHNLPLSPALEPVERIPSRIRILIEPEEDADGFEKGDEFDVCLMHESGTVFIDPDGKCENDIGFKPGEFEVIEWHGESELKETETGWRETNLEDAGAPMAVCLGRSKINTIGDLLIYARGDEPFHVLDGVGEKKSTKIRTWIQEYFMKNPEHLAEHNDSE